MNDLHEALTNAGIPMPSKDTETFKIVRWGHHNRYWLKKFDGGYVFGDFVNGLSSYVFEHEYNGEKLKEMQEKRLEASLKLEEELEKSYEQCAKIAQRIWNEANIIENCNFDYSSDAMIMSRNEGMKSQDAMIMSRNEGMESHDAYQESHDAIKNAPIGRDVIKNNRHAYLLKKKVGAYGIREYKGTLVIPAYDVNGKLCTLQFIDPAGNKRFLSGGKKKGCFFTFGSIENASKIFVCEGYATGATIHECTGRQPVVVAFDANSLEPVCKIIRKKLSNTKIFICADNDAYNEVNVGVEKAKEAAHSVDGEVIIPQFKDKSTKPTDFNDLCVLEGKDAVVAILKQHKEYKCNVPSGFSLSDDGLFFKSHKTNELIRICDYICVVAFIKEADGSISRQVKFKDYHKEFRETMISSKMFANAGDQAKVHLISHGFIMNWGGFEKKKLMQYLLTSVPSKEIELIEYTGYYGSSYLRPDQVLGNDDNVILSSKIRDDAISTKGSLDEWRANISAYCAGNSRLIFSASLAFASLLLKPCNVQSGGFHLAGTSSTGKTTCLRVASSIFGSPQYLKTWRATDNALENIAFKRNDALLVLDELSEMSAQKAGNVAYMFSHGEGKDRLCKNGNLRETFHWRTLFLSSGEVDLAAHLSEVDNKSKAGQEMRFISIPANPINRTNGVFENLHGFADVAEFGKHLQDSSSKYYGHASIEFIRNVLKDQNLEATYTNELKRLKAEYLPENSTSQDSRVFDRFMFVGFAGEQATKYGITGWASGEAYRSAVTCFQAWLKEKGGVGDLEEKRLMEQVLCFFETHVSSRFFDLDCFADQKVIKLAGYKKKVENELIFYVTTSVFKNEFCKGFNRNYAIETLQKNQVLQGCQQKWTPHGNKRVYVFLGKHFADYEV